MPRHKKRKRNRIAKHFSELGFTNRLALYVLVFLALGLAGGFYLAWKSIISEYTGALACYTVAFTPIGTATSIALSKVVDKNREENTDENGKGINFAVAEAAGFVIDNDDELAESPKI